MPTRVANLTAVDANNTALPLLTQLPYGTVALLAGSAAGSAGTADGTGPTARFTGPGGIQFAPDGLSAYIADSGTNRIRGVTVPGGVTSVVAGDTASGDTDGTGTAARFNGPFGLAISPDGTTLYIADTNNYRIKKMIIATGVVSTLAGSGVAGNTDGTGTGAAFGTVYSIAVSPDGGTLYLADYQYHKIRKMILATNAVSTLAGTGSAAETDGIGTQAAFNQPYGIDIDSFGVYAYVADYGGNTVRRMNLSSLAVTTIAGTGVAGGLDGLGRNASVQGPAGVLVDHTNTHLFIAERLGERVRKLNLATGRLSAWLGSGASGSADGDLTAATFLGPFRMAQSPDGQTILVTEYSGDRVRSVV